MNANPQRKPTSVEIAEVARLLPDAVEAELPDDRHRVLKEHLMREITQAATPEATRSADGPARGMWQGRRWVWVAAPAALATAALAAVAVSGGLPSGPGSAQGTAAQVITVEAGDKQGAGPLLQRISLVADSKPTGAVRNDQFVYIESKDSYIQISGDGAAKRVTMQPLHRRQIWLSVDGKTAGYLIEAASSHDVRNGITIDAIRTPSLNGPTYRYLESLPTDPDVLLAKIYAETKGAGNSADQEAFTTIGDMLRESITPPALSAALYKAAAKIPNVMLVNDSVDAAGRHGVAVAHVDDASGSRDEWIFNKDSLEFLGERTVQVTSVDDLKAGMVTGMSAVLTRAIVDKIKQTP